MDINITTIIVSIIIAVFTGFGSALLTYLSMKKKTTTEQIQLLLENLTKTNKDLVDKEAENRAEILKMHDQIRDLQQTVMLLESAHQDSPLPMWLKDTNGVMLSINSAYEETFNVKRAQYIGKTDSDIWPIHLAKLFSKNDAMVLRTGRVFHGEETVVVDEKEENWRVIKYPRYSGKIKIGIAGIAIPPEHFTLD